MLPVECHIVPRERAFSRFLTVLARDFRGPIEKTKEMPRSCWPDMALFQRLRAQNARRAPMPRFPVPRFPGGEEEAASRIADARQIKCRFSIKGDKMCGTLSNVLIEWLPARRASDREKMTDTAVMSAQEIVSRENFFVAHPRMPAVSR
jgi:hypothetical protein